MIRNRIAEYEEPPGALTVVRVNGQTVAVRLPDGARLYATGYGPDAEALTEARDDVGLLRGLFWLGSIAAFFTG